MSRDPELVHRLRLAIDEERQLLDFDGDFVKDSEIEAARLAVDSLVEQIAAP